MRVQRAPVISKCPGSAAVPVDARVVAAAAIPKEPSFPEIN